EVSPAAFEVDHPRSPDRRRQPDPETVVDAERLPDCRVPLRLPPSSTRHEVRGFQRSAFRSILAMEERFLAEDVARRFLHVGRDGMRGYFHGLDGSARGSDHSLVIAHDDIGGYQAREPLEELARKGILARYRRSVIDELER